MPINEPVIEVSHLCKRYGDRVAVQDVSFTVAEGEIFGILGPNGAGKTTTIECLAGLRKPDGGELSVLGMHPGRDRQRLVRQVGVQLQESQLPDKLSVAEVLRLYSSFYDDPADWRALADELGLTAQLATRFAKLSGGQRQRLSIVLALLGNPRIAILDELTTGLDPQARRDTWQLIERIRDRGVTVLLVSHFMEEAERLCDRLAVIDRGQVVAIDTPAGLIARVDTEQRIRFHPSQPLDDSAFHDVSGVTSVSRRGEQVVITGTGDVLMAVMRLLARDGIVAEQLRVDQTSLDDAFVALTAEGGPR